MAAFEQVRVAVFKLEVTYSYPGHRLALCSSCCTVHSSVQTALFPLPQLNRMLF